MGGGIEVKGGKGGRGRKSSNARHAGKGSARTTAKKAGDKRQWNQTAKKQAKKTTKLGAVRTADDD